MLLKFYDDKEILITGGTGFIGKACIEKLLRSFPDIGKIFVVVRGKKGKTIDERLQALLNDSVFGRLRLENPEALKKVYAIQGDCGQLGYGIKPEDLVRIQNVSIIYNSAATVRFDEDLVTAILYNTRGSHELVKLALGLKKLVVFVHISTVYCYPDKAYVKEEMYPPYADWRTTIRLAETYDIETMNIFSLKYTSFHPNTYTFSKSLSEHMVNDYRNELPIMILRLSIITSSCDEPMVGWIDNLNGPIGLSSACGLGLLSTIVADSNVYLDIVPIDFATRSMAIVPYKFATQRKTPVDQVEIINCANGNHRKLIFYDYVDIACNAASISPFNNAIWDARPLLTTSLNLYLLRLFLLDLPRMLLLDLILILVKKPLFFTKLHRRLTEANKRMSYFMCRSWYFDTDNFMRLDEVLNEPEMSDFSLSPLLTYNFDEYIVNALNGVKEFLLKVPKKPTKGAFFRILCYKVAKIVLRVYLVWFIIGFIYRYINKKYGASLID